MSSILAVPLRAMPDGQQELCGSSSSAAVTWRSSPRTSRTADGSWSSATRPRDFDRHDLLDLPAAAGGARREAAGRLVSVGPDLHPRQRHRKGRVSRRLRRARPDLRRARHQPARRRTCRDAEDYDFGQGAGFYVDATEEPWATNYRMWTYVTEELPALVAAEFPVDMDGRAITGHSMGGHGALTVALELPRPLPQRLRVRADRRAEPGAVGAEGAGRLSRRRSRGLAQA